MVLTIHTFHYQFNFTAHYYSAYNLLETELQLANLDKLVVCPNQNILFLFPATINIQTTPFLWWPVGILKLGPCALACTLPGSIQLGSHLQYHGSD